MWEIIGLLSKVTNDLLILAVRPPSLEPIPAVGINTF